MKRTNLHGVVLYTYLTIPCPLSFFKPWFGGRGGLGPLAPPPPPLDPPLLNGFLNNFSYYLLTLINVRTHDRYIQVQLSTTLSVIITYGHISSYFTDKFIYYIDHLYIYIYIYKLNTLFY